MALVVALFLAGKFAIYTGFFFLIAKILDLGVPFDAVRAGLHRTWLGAAATLIVLVLYVFLHMAGVAVEQSRFVGVIVIWVLRVAVWISVSTWVYRVTRWRKGKLALVVLAGLALNAAIDFGLDRLQGAHGSFIPSFGHWDFRLC